jgi:hypothetical protein
MSRKFTLMAEWPDSENFPSPLETTLVTSSSFVFNMESEAPAVGEVLRQCLEGGVFRVKLHATVSMRRGDEVEDKTFFMMCGHSSCAGSRILYLGNEQPEC